MNKPNPVGRPTVMSSETIAKLEDAFMYGANDKEACFLAEIGRTTFYDYCKENPEFVNRIEDLKDMTKMLAKRNIARAIQKEAEIGGGTSNSIWYAERKAKDEGYAVRTEVTGKDGKDLITVDPELKAKADQAINQFINEPTGTNQ
jgi:hypothetical protein